MPYSILRLPWRRWGKDRRFEKTQSRRRRPNQIGCSRTSFYFLSCFFSVWCFCLCLKVLKVLRLEVLIEEFRAFSSEFCRHFFALNVNILDICFKMPKCFQTPSYLIINNFHYTLSKK